MRACVNRKCYMVPDTVFFLFLSEANRLETGEETVQKESFDVKWQKYKFVSALVLIIRRYLDLT